MESPGLNRQRIRQSAERVLKDLACHNKELSILLTDDHRITKLNERYLGRVGPTNVLAFPMSGGPLPEIESPMLGDVVISLETARRESVSLDEPFEKTLDRLLIHGILHLLGYDHETSQKQAKCMEQQEQRLMSLITEE